MSPAGGAARSFLPINSLGSWLKSADKYIEEGFCEMIEDPVNIFWVIVGVFVWPEALLGYILWQLGYPWLGLFAFICASTSSVKTIVKEKIVYRGKS